MMTGIKTIIKSQLGYDPLPETALVRSLLDESQLCPSYEGDFLYQLVRDYQCQCALEIGLHTAASTLYLLQGLGQAQGELYSIEPNFETAPGKLLLQQSPYYAQHRLLTDKSDIALPELYRNGKKFDLIFLDGWKTIDTLMMDIYYVMRLLKTGGVIVFDDYQMPAVRKVCRLLRRYYHCCPLNMSAYFSRANLLYFRCLTKQYRLPFNAFLKTTAVDALPCSKDWNFHARF